MVKTYSYDLEQKVIKLCYSGLSHENVASNTGLSRHTVQNIWYASDEYKQKQMERKQKEKEVIDYIEQGLTYVNIADLVGLSSSQVSRIGHKHGYDHREIMKKHKIKAAEERKKQQKIEQDQRAKDNFNKRLNDFVSRINKYVDDYWEYDSGFVNKSSYVNMRCKRCHCVSSFYTDTFGERKLKTGTVPNCPICADIRESLKEEDRKAWIRLKVKEEYLKETLGADYYITPEQGDLIRQMRNHGVGLKLISDCLCVQYPHVKSWCIQHNISIDTEMVCETCGKTFVSECRRGAIRRYCSKKCASRASHIKERIRRKSRKKDISIVDKDISLYRLARRDNDTCWLCGEKVDWDDITYYDGYAVVGPMYPSTDHVTPLSKGGSHSWDNVRLAHHSCNTVKNDNLVESEEDFDDLVLDYNRDLFEPYAG